MIDIAGSLRGASVMPLCSEHLPQGRIVCIEDAYLVEVTCPNCKMRGYVAISHWEGPTI